MPVPCSLSVYATGDDTGRVNASSTVSDLASIRPNCRFNLFGIIRNKHLVKYSARSKIDGSSYIRGWNIRFRVMQPSVMLVGISIAMPREHLQLLDTGIGNMPSELEVFLLSMAHAKCIRKQC